MSEREARECLDAIRLAIQGAPNNQAAVTVIRTILADAPRADPKGTASVKRLLKAVKVRYRARLAVRP